MSGSPASTKANSGGEDRASPTAARPVEASKTS